MWEANSISLFLFTKIKKINCEKKHFYIDPELKEKVINWKTGEPSVERPYKDTDIIKILKY